MAAAPLLAAAASLAWQPYAAHPPWHHPVLLAAISLAAAIEHSLQWGHVAAVGSSGRLGAPGAPPALEPTPLASICSGAPTA
jgi:hypothetical protein